MSAVMSIWWDKTYYDGRFVVGDDLYHRFFEVAHLCALASVVAHIGSVEVLSSPSKYADAFGLCASLAITKFLFFLRQVEVYYTGVGERQILENAFRREGSITLLATVLFTVAAIVAGLEFFGGSDSTHRRSLAEAAKDDYSSESKKSDPNDIPVFICLGAELVRWVAFAILFLLTPNDGSHKKSGESLVLFRFVEKLSKISFANVSCLLLHTVDTFSRPNEYRLSHSQVSDFSPLYFRFGLFFFCSAPLELTFTLPTILLYRTAEWTMLMLGESILSLLIVDVPYEDGDYFATFYCGLLTVTLLQVLHFRSQPHLADQHATRRDKVAGIYWTMFQYIYSMSLVALGAAFTLFLIEFSFEENGYDDHRRLVDPLNGRVLAGGGAPKYDKEEREQRLAHLYSMSLSLVFLSLDIMSILHVGLKNGKNRCVCEHTKKKNTKGIFLVIFRGSLILFIATLSQWTTSPHVLAGIGLGVTLIQLGSRKLGAILFPTNQVHAFAGEFGETDVDDSAKT